MKRLAAPKRLPPVGPLLSIAAFLTFGAWIHSAAAQRAPANDRIEVVQLREDFYVIGGAGGNIVVQIGPQGVILVDSGATARAPEVLEAIRRLTPLPIRYIINTSMDADHVGGNEVLSKAGLSILPGAVAAGAGLGDDVLANFGHASVLAHENVLTRMSAAKPPIPSVYYPTKTFFYRQYGMYLNGEGIQVIHQPAAHTDGNVIVFFRRGDVIATGDVIDTTRFPFIDVERGGTLQGELDALNRLMDMSIHNVPLTWYPDRTFLVPGHGHVYDKLDLLEYRDAITIIRDRVQDLIDQGKTLAQVQAANPTLGYRSQYGTDSGPWTTEKFVAAVYNELTAKKGRQ
ncbi:MAG TPA: MBL fold metallo-hydrolase [Gammaproteobacteria bacterium]|nr:MBL fold metallo-hydrolase [Gammaproteobacteria bacterium]